MFQWEKPTLMHRCKERIVDGCANPRSEDPKGKKSVKNGVRTNKDSANRNERTLRNENVDHEPQLVMYKRLFV